jgi:DNA-binding CsgD family transcriptional regulator
MDRAKLMPTRKRASIFPRCHWRNALRQPDTGSACSPASFPPLVGRDDELGQIAAFVRDAAERGGALLLSGDAGVGKSVLLDAAASRALAAGTCVLRADGAQFETGVSFSFLSQLFLPALGALGGPEDLGAMSRLSAVHASALRRALGWSDGTADGPLVLSNAAVALIREAAADRPVLMVLDDLHWADPASAAVLGFVARRLSGLRAGFIGAILPGDDGFFDRPGLPVLEIGPLDRAASETLLTSCFPALAPRVRRRLLAEAQGNPLALLELPVPLSEEQRQARSALPAVLPLTRRLLSLFAARVANLPEPTRSLLLLAALDGTGDLGVLEAAAQRSTDELAPAERARLVRFDEPGGRLVFRHPLVRSAVVEQSTIDERRRAHRTLAGLAELAARSEQRALHLAEATIGPDEPVACMLEKAAYRTLRRGDPVSAVSMLLRSAELSRNQDTRSRRMLEAAYVDADVAGQMSTAVQLLDAAEPATPAGSLRAAITAAHVLLNGDGEVDTAHRLLTAAISTMLDRTAFAAPEADDMLPEAMHVLMLTCWFGGRTELWLSFYSLLARLRPQPRTVVLEAAVRCDPARAAAADLTELDAQISFLQEETDPASIVRVADITCYLDRTADCREALWRLVRDARSGGAVASGISAMRLLASEDFREGLWDEAEQLSDEGTALCDAHGYHLLGWLHRYNQALLAAGRGDEQAVCRLTAAISSWAEPRGMGCLARYAAHARALAAIGHGDFEEAYRQESAISSPGTFPQQAPDVLLCSLALVEAAVRTGRHADATAHATAMHDAALPTISPRLALLTAGAAAIAAPDDVLFETALASPGAHRWPFELARIRLAYGEHLRRSRAKTKASIQLTTALEAFERLGAAPWAARAGSELRACGLARTCGNGESLSPREREIASLAASGLTNKQIGDQLFLSPRTVGDHLHKIFPKLGINTRAALRDALDVKAHGRSDNLS